MDDVIRPELPVIRRPQVMVIPRRAFEQRAPAVERHEAELPGARFEIAVEMRGMDFAIGRPLLHRFGILGDGKFQQARLVPDFNRLDERPGGKIAMPDRAHTAAVDLRPDGIRDAKFENHFRRRWEFRKRHDVAPDFFRRRVDDDRRLDGEERQRRRRCMFKAHRQRQENSQRAKQFRRLGLKAESPLHAKPQHATYRSNDTQAVLP